MDDHKIEAAELYVDGKLDYALYLYTLTINDEESPSNEKLQAYIKRGTCYYHLRKFKESIRDLEAAQLIDKYTQSPYMKLAEIYLIEGNFVQAKQTLINLLTVLTEETTKDAIRQKKQDYEDIERLEIRAKKAYKENDFQKVVELMDDCLRISQVCLRHKIRKTKCLIYLQKFEEAAEQINNILFNGKDEIDAIYLRGLNNIYQQKYQIGIEDIKFTCHELYKDIDNINSKNVFDLYKDVEQYIHTAGELKQTDLNGAKELYKQILLVDSKNFMQQMSMHIEIAKIEIEQKKFKEALISITNALLIEKNNLIALKLRAEISIKLKEFKDAIDDYNTIVRIEKTEENSECLQNAQDLSIKNEIDHYKMLDLKKEASISDIQKSFKKLALKYHPDKLSRQSKAEQLIGHRKYIRIEESYKFLTQTK